MLNAKEVEPMVWPSLEEAKDLIRGFLALPDFERIKNETTLESHLKEKIRKVKEKLMKMREKKKEYMVDQLMVQINHGRKIDDPNLHEIHGLLSFSKDKIIQFKNRLGITQYPPIRDPPVNPFDAESNSVRTNTNDVFMIGGGQDDERAGNTYEASKRINIGNALRDNQSHYLMDQWVFASSEPLSAQVDQTIKVKMGSDDENPYPIRHLSYQRSTMGGTNLIGPPMPTFYGSVASVSQLLQHNNMNNNPTLTMSQPRQYAFEERLIINDEDTQFHLSTNTISSSSGLRQE
ncbi:unnamed protein product [Arabis nemorensis]|uniref:MADS-box domain-containing protein n=1 Tax=Arabis nemorensis TaxID=586526 RepID=A0A565BL00_9BRAS|nr:unnamed protein product [Arabis nemorensis]